MLLVLINPLNVTKHAAKNVMTLLSHLDLSGVPTSGQNEPGSNGNEGVLCIP